MRYKSYVPAYELVGKDTSSWEFIKLKTSYSELISKDVFKWCDENLSGQWTITTPQKFGFSNPESLMYFNMNFQ